MAVRRERRSAISYFPSKHRPRQVQTDVINAIEQHWNTTDVFCVNVPVAGGKSDLLYTIARFAGKAMLLTPSRILVDQYLADFPGIPYLKAKDDYLCPECVTLGASSCYEAARLRGSSKKPLYLATCLYPAHIKRSHIAPYMLCNYHVAMAHKLQRDVLLVDEAHGLIPFIQGFSEKILWQHIWKYPNNIYTQADLLSWLCSRKEINDETEELKAILQEENPKYILERKRKEFGREEKETGMRRELDCICLRPIDIRDRPPLLWGRATKKIILASATIGPMDVEALGIGSDRGYRVSYVEAQSPIPACNRPIIIAPIANLSFATQDAALPVLAQYVQRVHAQHGQANGVVHLTYGLAYKLKKILDSPDFMWHDRDNRSKIYEEFRSLPANSGKVLFACGLYEGIDLKEDIARWQILAKIPWPSLADVAVRHKADKDPAWYTWNTLKVVLQFSGRVCRTPTDFGVSYIVDTSWKRLWKDAERMAPTWFKEAITTESL